jgi:hypothetical protein
MINNEPCFYVADSMEEIENRSTTLNRIYFVRPIYEKEKLPNKKDFSEDDVTCEYFLALNALHSLYVSYNLELYFRDNGSKFNSGVWETVVSNVIGNEYCDCMSGGMPIDKIKIIRTIVELFDMDLDMNCYVNYSLREFMGETNKFGRSLLNLTDGRFNLDLSKSN